MSELNDLLPTLDGDDVLIEESCFNDYADVKILYHDELNYVVGSAKTRGQPDHLGK